MGLFRSSASATSVSAANSPKEASAAATDGISQQKQQTKSPPPLTEEEQLNLLVAGARLDDTEAHDTARFLRSNKRHTYTDAFLGFAVYTFSGLQHIQGQSNALTLLTMWTVGTTFLVDVAERKFLQESLQTTSPAVKTTGIPETQETDIHPPRNAAAAASSSTSGNVTGTPATVRTLVPQEKDKLMEQQRQVYLTQAVASWVWMLASFQQFKVHKRLKWCGYSSWMGLGCAGYYTTRHLYNLMVK